MARDPQTGESKGYGFVSYTDFEAADAAIEAMNGQFLMNKQITVQYAFKKDGKGERHGTPAERLLAAQARKNNALPAAARPPPAPMAFGPRPPMPMGMPMGGPPMMGYPGAPPPGGGYQGQYAGALAPPPPPPGFAPQQVVGPPAGMPMYNPAMGAPPPPPPGFGMPPGGFMPPPPPGFGGPPPGMMPPGPPPPFATGANAS